VHIAESHMKLPVRVEVARPGTLSEMVVQELYVVHKDQKLRLLEKLLADFHGSVLVFSRTKYGAKKIARAILAMGYNAAEIHSNRSLAQRREALDGFKSGKYRVLVATDIAARGIDVTGIELVLNYDIPDKAEDYVHRIGRTARAGQPGHAISFAEPDQGGDVSAIEKFARVNLPISKLPELPPARFLPPVSRDEDNSRFSKSRQAPVAGGFGRHRAAPSHRAPNRQYASVPSHAPRIGRDDFGGEAPTPVYESRRSRPQQRRSGGPHKNSRYSR